MRAARERILALPAWARWGALYAAALAASALLALLTPLTLGDGVFVAGGALILASVTQVRLGGPRREVVGRTPDGVAIRREVEPEKRERELRRGMGLFLVGVALWLTLGAAVWLRARL